MKRVRTAVMYAILFVLTLYSLIVLLYDIYTMNAGLILDNALLRSPDIYHAIVSPMRGFGTLVAFVLFVPFLRLFLIDQNVALALFVVIQISALLVIHVALLYISLAFVNKAIKNGERFFGAPRCCPSATRTSPRGSFYAFSSKPR